MHEEILLIIFYGKHNSRFYVIFNLTFIPTHVQCRNIKNTDKKIKRDNENYQYFHQLESIMLDILA